MQQGGLPPLAWYDVLHELAEAGEGGLRPFQLTERTLFAQYNISRLLARLEADGLVEKLKVADDGRGQTIRITAKGRETRRRMWAVYGRSIAELVGAKLSADEDLWEIELGLGHHRLVVDEIFRHPCRLPFGVGVGVIADSGDAV